MRPLFALALATLALTSCDLFDPEPVRGCTDPNALNREFGADEDDGSCEFSRVIFYKGLDGPPVDVTLDGQPVGTITAFYPTGPGNCSAPGNATVRLRDGSRYDWAGTSGPHISTGTVQASRGADCIRIRVF